MTAAYASVQALLAQGSEYVPDAHALRELYSFGKAQATIMPSISSPAIGYQSRMHLLPSTERVRYGRSGIDTGLQSKLGDDLLGLKKIGGNINYGSNFGYLVSQREAEIVSRYRQ